MWKPKNDVTIKMNFYVITILYKFILIKKIKLRTVECLQHVAETSYETTDETE